MTSRITTPTVEVDGQNWIQRAGRLWGDYETLTSYGGRSSIESTVNFCARHNLTRVKHGKHTIVPKDDFDAATGAVSKRRSA